MADRPHMRRPDVPTFEFRMTPPAKYQKEGFKAYCEKSKGLASFFWNVGQMLTLTVDLGRDNPFAVASSLIEVSAQTQMHLLGTEAPPACPNHLVRCQSSAVQQPAGSGAFRRPCGTSFAIECDEVAHSRYDVVKDSSRGRLIWQGMPRNEASLLVRINPHLSVYLARHVIAPAMSQYETWYFFYPLLGSGQLLALSKEGFDATTKEHITTVVSPR